MAYRPRTECPLCRERLEPNRALECHLVEDHPKRALAKFVVTETVAYEEGDVS